MSDLENKPLDDCPDASIDDLLKEKVILEKFDNLNKTCKLCDNEFGSAKLYENQHLMPLSGRVRSIDPCIAHIVAALNAGGVETVACCCGHNIRGGRIDLKDGRILRIENPNRSIDHE